MPDIAKQYKADRAKHDKTAKEDDQYAMQQALRSTAGGLREEVS